MIISYSKNFIYIHLDKTGGTSIEECLTPYLDFNDILFGGVTLGQYLEDAYLKYYGDKYWSLGIHKHSTAEQIKKYVGSFWDSSYKFSTVRNPIDIMLSLYHYNKDLLYRYLHNSKHKNLESLLQDNIFLEQIKKDDNDGLLVLLKQILNNDPIDSFICFLIESKHSGTVPQIEKLSYDQTINIFDIDHIKSHWKNILLNIGLNNNIELPFYNKSSNSKNINLKLNTQNIIRDHFAEDYKIIPKITGSVW